MGDYWRVEVSDHDGQIVAIESDCLCGRDIGDNEKAKIIKSASHLLGFVGIGFDVDAANKENSNA